jgi:hypothetical protein
MSDHVDSHSRQIRQNAIAIVIIAAVATATWLEWQRRQVDPLTELAQKMRAVDRRPFRARLAAPFPHVPYAAVRERKSVDPTLLSLQAAAAKHFDAADGRTAALSRLLAGDYSRAVALLQNAARTAPSADTLSDLSAALLVQSGSSGNLLPAIDALAAADDALRLAPTHAAAAFNRALALEQLGLDREAIDAWQKCAALEPESEWRAEVSEATARLSRIVDGKADWNAARATLEAAVRRGDRAAVAAIVKRYPRDARAWGESVYTAAWAEAVLRGDPAAAVAELEIARAIADALRERGERLLTDAIGVIDDTRDGAALANAYLLYRQGRIEHSKTEPGALTHLLEAAAAFERAKSPMALAARYYTGSALYAQQKLDQALAVLDALAAKDLERRGYIALAAQIGWERGLAVFLRGELSRAAAIFEESRRRFDALGDVANSAVMREFVALTLDTAGDAEQAWRIRRAALEDLERSGDERRKHTAIRSATTAMLSRREWRRARPLLDVLVNVDPKAIDPAARSAALAQRAATLGSLGDGNGARRDLDELYTAIREIATPEVRSALLVDAHYAEALLVGDTDPAAAVDHLTRAVSELHRAGRAVFLSRIYLERSRASARAGNRAAARADISEGLEWMEQNRGTISDPQLRALAAIGAEELFQDGMELALADGEPAPAFALAERARARALLDSFQGHGRAVAPLALGAIQSALAPRSSIIDYAMLGDRVVMFVVTPDNLRIRQHPISAGALDGLNERASHGDLTPDDLESAWRLLIEPVMNDLAGIERVAFSPDRRLSAIPFLALRDGRRNRFVIDDFMALVTPSASLAIAASQRAASADAISLLAIGATDFDRRQFPNVDMLPWVGEEARSIEAMYERGTLIAGATATPKAIADALCHANVIHYAGHSVAPVYDRGASALLLAPSDSGSTLTAREIARLDLSQTELVVLSSCHSAAAGRIGDGVENLASAFVVAGVPSVVAARWSVEDRTAAELSIAFHRHYREHRDAARAFREAVLERPRTLATPSWAVVTPFGGSPGFLRKGE